MAQQRQPEREPERHLHVERERAEPRGPREAAPRERMEARAVPPPEYWTASGPLYGIEGPEEEDRVESLELNAAATVATPAPLGLAGFAASTFTLGAILAGWAPITGLVATVPILFVFGGLAEFVAAMWAFRKNNTFWATFLGVFGSWYLVIAFDVLMGGGGILAALTGAGIPSVGIGVSVAMFAFIAAYLAWAATGISSVMVWVLGLLTAYLALLAVGFFVGIANAPLVMMAAGYCALVSGLIAFYASAAIVINSSLQREVLPF